MAAYGKIEDFQEGEDWGQYVERLGHYFEANEIDDAGKRKAIFLSVCGSKVYKLMCDLLAPQKPGDKTFNELCDTVKDHLQPKPSEIVERYKFHSYFRQSGQSVADYVAHLRNLSVNCNFGATLDLMIRDRLVCGVNDDRIQRRLLAERDLDYKKALEISQAMEQAAKNAADLQKNDKVNVLKPLKNKKSQKKVTKECWRCGGTNHLHYECFFKDKDCHKCGIKGHVAKKCKKTNDKESKPSNGKKNYKQKFLEDRKDKFESNNTEDEDQEYSFFKIGDKRDKAIIVNMSLNGTEIPMEIDTGASKTVITEQTLKMIESKLESTQTVLRTYTGEKIPIKGECSVKVTYGEQKSTLQALVVKSSGPNLMGRDWLSRIKLKWNEIFSIQEERDILHGYDDIFDGTLGTYKGMTARICIKEGSKPKYFKSRPVPYALKTKIGEELNRLEKEGTISKVQYSEWAAPIVPIVKEDGSIRICGDYKVTVNPVSIIDNYPIPKTDDLFAEIKGKYFSKLDLSNAYQQIKLDEESKKYTTINTHLGLYVYNRLPYGISSSPGIFQRIMDNILQGLKGVRVRVDDILVAGTTIQEHDSRVREVLDRLTKAGLKLKKKKCVFTKTEVVYLGHKISEEGIEPLREKVRAIEGMKRPESKKELQSYLGLINYYARFIPKASEILTPLYVLLNKGQTFVWGEEQDKAWTNSKKLLLESNLLVHFDQSKELILTCDASPHGLGSVLAHRMEDGSERPIAFASRTLTKSEKNYSQIEKEGLSIVFGVKKFHQYLYGNQTFTIVTDHKPLLGLFKENKSTSTMSSARILRWAITLSAYSYKLVHKPGTNIGNADSLSRFPVKEVRSDPPIPGETILLMKFLDECSPVTAKTISKMTSKDPVLSKVKIFVKQGWPNEVNDKDIKPYFNRKNEISVVDECLLWGSRVIIPKQVQTEVLNVLHEGHIGMTKMKSLSRSYVWWPNMDKEIEQCVKTCNNCIINSKDPCRVPLHSWEWPRRPWSRIHIDYAGPFMGKMFLIIIDAYSKWMDVYPTLSGTSEATIELLRQSFAIHGLPDTIVSDNGSCFTSAEFQKFVTLNGIKNVTSAPFHPASNGLAERAVQIFKNGMKKQGNGSIQTKVSRFLLQYRTTVHATTNQTPAEMLNGRKPKTRMDLIRPDLRREVENSQTRQGKNHPCKKMRQFQVGDSVYIRNFSVHGEKWLKGSVVERLGALMYKVKISNGSVVSVVKRHIEQMRECYDSLEISVPSEKEIIIRESVPVQLEIPSKEKQDVIPIVEQNQGRETETEKTKVEERVQRPIRDRRRPVKFKDYV